MCIVPIDKVAQIDKDKKLLASNCLNKKTGGRRSSPLGESITNNLRFLGTWATIPQRGPHGLEKAPAPLANSLNTCRRRSGRDSTISRRKNSPGKPFGRNGHHDFQRHYQ